MLVTVQESSWKEELHQAAYRFPYIECSFIDWVLLPILSSAAAQIALQRNPPRTALAEPSLGMFHLLSVSRSNY